MVTTIPTVVYGEDATATYANIIKAAVDEIQAVIAALIYTDTFTGVITENASSVTITHNLGHLPTAVAICPVGRIGEVWYNPDTISTTQITIVVANPPAPGSSYTIKVVLYHT